MSDGSDIIFAVYSAFPGLTALVPVDRIINDDALPKGIVLPALQLEIISEFDSNIANPGEDVFCRHRVRTRIHANTASERSLVRRQVRRALFANQRATVPDFSNVTIHTDGGGPTGLAPGSNVRVGLQDAIVTFSQER